MPAAESGPAQCGHRRLMPRYKMIVMTKPVEGREEAYNDWYQNTHLRELVALPGIRSARRYRRAHSLVAGDSYPYMAIYEIEADDLDAVVAGIIEASGSGGIWMSDAIDLGDKYAVIYEEFGAEVSAPGE